MSRASRERIQGHESKLYAAAGIALCEYWGWQDGEYEQSWDVANKRKLLPAYHPTHPPVHGKEMQATGFAEPAVYQIQTYSVSVCGCVYVRLVTTIGRSLMRSVRTVQYTFRRVFIFSPMTDVSFGIE